MLKDKLVRGGAWALLARLFGSIVQYGTQVVVARILLPDDYGLVAMAAVFTGLASLFTEFGFGAAIVQRETLSEEETDAAFSALAIAGLASGLLLIVAAPTIADYYHRPVLINVTRLAALSFLPSTASVVPRALMLRELAGRKLALIDVCSSVFGAATIVALALRGFGVWSIAISNPLLATFTALITWIASGYRPRSFGHFKAAGPLASVGLYIFGYSFLNYWARNIDNLLIGKWMGERELGLYNRAYVLMLLPVQQIAGPLAGIFTAGLASVQNDKARARSIFLRTLSGLSLVTFPMMLGLAACADPFVRVMFGTKWLGLIPLLRVLGVVGAFQSVGNPSGWIYLSQGRTDWMFRWGAFGCSVLIAALWLGALRGTAISVAIAYLVATAALTIPALLIPGRLIGFGFFDLIRAIGRQWLVASVMAVAVFYLDAHFPRTLPDLLRLFCEVLFGALFYVLAIRLAASAAYDDLLLALSKKKPAPAEIPREG